MAEGSDLRERSVEPRALDSGRLTCVFAVLSVAFVVVLGSAPLRPYFAEWRQVQTRYNRLAAEAGLPATAIAVQQIWKPALGVTDRCVTCHLGMGASGPVPGDPLFRAHPPIPHDPLEMGCTICHGGQGRATTRAAAHGFVSHWDEQLLDIAHQPAGCGACHDALPAATRPALARGLHLVESLDCLSCHRLDGRGRGEGPDLSYVGLTGYRAEWHDAHLAEQARDDTGFWTARYGPIPADEVAALDAFLRTRTGAPRVVEWQALALERGCLGCHRISGRGGDEGPALDRAGLKPVGDLDFAGVSGEPTLANYLRQHLLDPPGVVTGSQMPPQAETEEEARLLTSFVLFLRSRDLPAAWLPPERLRRELLGEPAEPMSGALAFGAFCSGCHGPEGEGRNYGNLDTRFPAIGHPDFLDVASDEFIATTIREGRLGRRMPALGGSAGSLATGELDAIVDHLRARAPQPHTLAAVERAASDRALGERVYRADCAACHGERGEGTALGSPLAAADRRAVSRAALHAAVTGGVPDTMMPRYSAHEPAALRSLLDYVAALPATAAARATWRPGTGRPAHGEPVYARHCAGCHGARGEGGSGPSLANRGFLLAATEAYVAATIVRGRAGSPMPGFGRDSVSYPRLSPEEVLDMTAYILNGVETQNGEAGPEH